MLYLNVSEIIQVRLDGPALRINHQHQADRLFPLGQLAGVVVIGMVSWETQAIIACAEQGVSIHFISHRGVLRAQVCGTVSHYARYDMNEPLSRFFELPDGTNRYHDWFEAGYHQARMHLAKTMYLSRQQITRLDIMQRLHSKLLYCIDEAAYNLFQQRVRGFLSIKLADLLRQKGIDPKLPILTQADIDIVRDFTQLCYYELAYNLRFFLQYRFHQPIKETGREMQPALTDAIEFTEKYNRRLQRFFSENYKRFCLHILMTLHEYAGK